MRRFSPIALAVAFLLSATVGDALALTTQRTWTAKVGTDGANGRATMRAYTVGTGSLSLSLKSLRASREYTIRIWSGTCSNLGSVLASLYPAVTSSTGTISTSRNIPGDKMNAIWKVARTKSIALRVGNGSSFRCGNLTFPVATRITISRLSIDLPIIRGPSGYPPCKVAMYMPTLSQPREPGVSLIYAHARSGMFLPLLQRSKINDGASLIGMRLRVYTSDSKVSLYEIYAVARHQTTIQSAVGVTAERLWLYTSEGPNFTYPKLIVKAKRLSTASTTYAASHPRARPVAC